MTQSSSNLSFRWVEVRPSRASVFMTYANRAVNKWGNSKPFLSGDLFSDEADVSFFSPKFRRLKPSLKTIKQARVIFCPSSRLEEMLEAYSGIISPQVLICGNDDRDFVDLPPRLPKSLKHLFLQNSFIPNSKFVTSLPIGIENLRWGKNGFPRLMKNEIPWSEKVNKVMVGPYGLTHEARFQVRQSISQSSNLIELFESRLSPDELSAISQRFKFIASVRGNGVDTHRHWETAYRGSVALIQKSSWLSNFENSGLPFIGIDCFEEEEIQLITSQLDFTPSNPQNVPILWWPYWKSKIQNSLAG
jgi:hypothetical protein